MTYHFATNFDTGRFLLRGLALYRSLERHGGDFVLWNLCMDDKIFERLSRLGLKNLRLVRLSDIEDAALLEVKKVRLFRDYCISIKSHFLEWLLAEKSLPSIAWLDSDLYFFDSPKALYDELGRGSVLITPNRFPERIRERQERYCGRYNAGMEIFKNDERGREVLAWWSAKCIEWCKSVYEDGRYGEQLYMDEFPKRFRGVVASRNFGANVSYWNIEENYEVARRGGRICLKDRSGEERRLVFYHFSNASLYKAGGRIRVLTNRRHLRPAVKRLVYDAYSEGLEWAAGFARMAGEKEPFGGIKTEAFEYARLRLAKDAVSYAYAAREWAERRLAFAKRAAKNALSFFKDRSYALDGLDLKLKPYLAEIENGFFVEAGGNDGVSQSNTLYFEKNLGWRGLLVEAIPELADKCRKNRPKAIVEEAALVSKDYGKKTVPMRYGGLMSVVEGGMRTREEEDAHIQKAREIKNIETYETEVPAMTLGRILDKHGIAKIDLLSLDVEGYELEALKGLDLEKCRPRYILVEARYKEDIDQFMRANGYKEIARLSDHDYLYE